jgi:hypothetical protein
MLLGPLDQRDDSLGGSSFRLCFCCSPLTAVAGDSEALEILLSHPQFDVNAADGTGRTLLHWSAAAGQPAMLALLLGPFEDLLD